MADDNYFSRLINLIFIIITKKEIPTISRRETFLVWKIKEIKNNIFFLTELRIEH